MLSDAKLTSDNWHVYGLPLTYSEYETRCYDDSDCSTAADVDAGMTRLQCHCLPYCGMRTGAVLWCKFVLTDWLITYHLSLIRTSRVNFYILHRTGQCRLLRQVFRVVRPTNSAVWTASYAVHSVINQHHADSTCRHVNNREQRLKTSNLWDRAPPSEHW